MWAPRPECPDIAEEYARIIPEFHYRLKVKAGLTGFAQVYGKYNTTPYDKLKLDLTYIENYSFWLDIKLILLTFKILFQKENTEGLEDWQNTAATRENLKRIRKIPETDRQGIDMREPQVSVIIPAYNCAGYISKAIDSALARMWIWKFLSLTTVPAIIWMR